MSRIIYYFSGTGNSLVVARDIAEKIHAQIIFIPSVIQQRSIKTGADMIGIVFPMYHHGIPLIIKRFINKMDDLDTKYIFGVCTYGGSPGICLKYLERIIKSNHGRLAAGFAVQMPYNYIFPSFVLKDFFNSFVLRETSIEKQQKMFDCWRKKLERICDYILARREGKLEIKAEIIEGLVDSLLRETLQKYVWLKVAGVKEKTNLPFQESIQLMDYGFRCDDKCNGCEVCSKICPVQNIKMLDNRPVWQHHCEQCFACLQWCPKEAIQFGSKTAKGKRYHHPNVKISDMIIDGK